MSPALVLDTGVLLWMSQGSEHLGPRTRALIEEAGQGGSLSFSAVSMLEVARLHGDGRIDLRRAPELWHRELIDRGVREIHVTAEIALFAAALESREAFLADPADQLIAATAIVARRQLVTSDRKILHWATGRTEPSCLDART